MAEKNTINIDLGTSIRDIVRVDSVILAFNTGVDAKEWIFMGRPQDLERELNSPHIIIEPVDQARESYSVDKKQDVLIPFLFHAWLPKEGQDALAAYEIADRLAKIGNDLDDDPDDQGIWEAEVVSSSIVPENQDKKEIDHIIVRVQIVWRENIE